MSEYAPLIERLRQEARRKAIARQGLTTTFRMPGESDLALELEGQAADVIHKLYEALRPFASAADRHEAARGASAFLGRERDTLCRTVGFEPEALIKARDLVGPCPD